MLNESEGAGCCQLLGYGHINQLVQRHSFSLGQLSGFFHEGWL